MTQCDDRYSTIEPKAWPPPFGRVCYFTKDQKQKRTLFLAIVRSQLNQHCCVVWRPANDSTRIAPICLFLRALYFPPRGLKYL